MHLKNTGWQNSIWMIILVTLILIILTGWFFQHNVDEINQELDKIRKHENQ